MSAVTHPAVARPHTVVRARLGEDRLSFLLGLFVIVLFSGVWLKPLTGYTTIPMDSPLIRGLYYPGYLAGFWLAALGPGRIWRGLWRTPLIWVLVAFAFVSVHWSIDKGITERRALALALSVFTAATIGARFGWRRLTLLLASAYLLIGLANLAAGALVPSFGRMQEDFPGAWSGLFIEKNGMGGFEASGVVFAMAAILVDPRRKGLWAGAAALGLVLLILSQSKTSLVLCLVGLAAVAFCWAVRRGPAMAVIATFVGVTGAGLLAALIWLAPQVPLALLGKDATLTGRTRIWAAVWRQIELRPTTGYGYGAIWSDTSGHGPVAWIIKQIELRPTYAHNGWLDLWLALGVYAVWLCALMLAVTLVCAILAAYRRRDAALALAEVAMFTLMNLTESQLLAYNDLITMQFVMVATCLAASIGERVSVAPGGSPRPAGWPPR